MAFPANSPLGRLLAAPMRPGRLKWIGLRPARRCPIESRTSAALVAGHGAQGDHYEAKRDGPRQVTLITIEDIAAIAAFLGLPEIAPDVFRRNLVTSGINLVALKDRQFRIGTALLEGTGECAPCSRMEENLGPGGFNAVRGHGGITARVIEGGEIHVGDRVERTDVPAHGD